MTLRRWAAGLLATVGVMAGLEATQTPRWTDLPAATQRRLTASGLDASSLAAFLVAHERRTTARVREGDLDALIYYALQSTTFTSAQPIEPALDAKAFVEGLDAGLRARFLSGEASPVERVPVQTRQRLLTFAQALQTTSARGRLGYFRDIVRSEARPGRTTDALFVSEYVRAMRFLYQKEFVARQEAGGAPAVAALYQGRALSTDTAIEAGYLAHLGLAMVRAVQPDWRARRVLIVGPGLDLAPRTGLLEAGEPESYQPYAIVDSLVHLGLAEIDRLAVIGGDVNPRVVDHLNRARPGGVQLALVTAVAERDAVRFEEDFREYFEGLGRATSEILRPPALGDRYRGHLRKAVRVSPAASRVISGARLDIVTGRTAGDAFDLIVVTNVFPYLDDVELTLALANVAAMLKPGGVLLHNEARPLVGELTNELGLPLTHSRSAVLARVQGSTPHYDSVFIHVKNPRP